MNKKILIALFGFGLLGLLVVGGLFAGVAAISAQSPTATPSAAVGSSTVSPSTPAGQVPALGPAARLAALVARIRLGRVATITGINGTTLTLSMPNGGTQTLSTDGKTRFLRAGQSISLSDFKVGDKIRVQATKINGVLTATAVRLAVPGVVGTITAIDGNKISIKQGNLTATVVAGPSTVLEQGGKTIGLADLSVGDQIGAIGTPNSDGSLAAERIQKRIPGASGKVTGVSGTTITIQRGLYSGTVSTDSTTVFLLNGQLATLGDVKVGSSIQAQGTPNGTGSLKATLVRIKPNSSGQ